MFILCGYAFEFFSTIFKNPALIYLFYKVLAVLPHRGIIIVEYTKFQKCGKKWKSEYFQGVRSF